MNALTPIEKGRLELLEKKIEKGLETFIEVGTALKEIREKKLYSQETFEKYCEDRWGWSIRYVQQIIATSKATQDLRTIVRQLPTSEWQARPLTKLPEPKQRERAWELAVSTAPDNKPTARHVEQAVRKIQAQEPSIPTVKSTFNNQTTDNIEWAKWSWNPVTGCKTGCRYCYARDIANRFSPDGFEPTFHANRLEAPVNTNIPESRKDEPGIHNVFTVSMGDLFGKWVPQKWIDDVLKVVGENPQWQFLFLTKNPKRYEEIIFPNNAWVGVTADTQKRMDEAVDILRGIEAKIKFISSEPLLERIETEFRGIDWLIIGSQSKSTELPAFQPEWSWVTGLMDAATKANIPVYCKPNLQVMIRKYPEV